MFLRNFRYLCFYPWLLTEADACGRHVDDHFLFLFVWKCVWSSVSVVIQFSQMFLLICLKGFFLLHRYVFSKFTMHLMFLYCSPLRPQIDSCLNNNEALHVVLRPYERIWNVYFNCFYKILVVSVNMNKLMH